MKSEKKYFYLRNVLAESMFRWPTEHLPATNTFRLVLCILLFCCYNNMQAQELKIDLSSSAWSFREGGKDQWMPATVPGTVHTDLIANKKISDPFYRTAEKELQWIGTTDWEYKTTFTIDERLLQHQNIDLHFEGLDTYADVFVNDKQILSADNMFRSWTKEIRNNLVKGQNTLSIYFHSPINKVMPAYRQLGYRVPVSNNDQADERVSVFSRKAGYHFGWDWGPRLVTSGIWRPVYLRAWNTTRFDDVFIKQKKLETAKATLEAQVEISSATEGVKRVEVYVENSKTPIVSKEVFLSKGLATVVLPFEIKNPELWWPNGLGKQRLYNFKVQVKDGANIVGEKNTRRGLRTIEVVQEANEKGQSFYFKVNGVPVFAKGANYIPQDNFLTRVTPQRYQHIIETAAQSNMNMLRVWGGGIYENEIFYNLCDEKGILVWQDFMFACALFPPSESLKQNIYAEAVENVKRLRNHPSIALWCGNNEIVQFFNQNFWGQTKADWKPKDSLLVLNTYAEIFHNILPSAVKAHDDEKFYWSSSPNGSNYSMKFTGDGKRGDMHYWGVWHGREPFEKFNEVIPSFMSEYGFQSFPEIETVKKFALPQDYSISSDVMTAHQRSGIGNEAIAQYMKARYRTPADFNNFLYVGQVLQAEGIRMAIEAHRRGMPYCMGSLYWQLDDCWPAASWSSMDYYGRWKALQYAVKKAFDPLLLSIVKEGDEIKLFAVSDDLKPLAATLQIQLVDFSGKVLSTVQKKISVSPNSSNVVHTIKEADLIKDHNRAKVCLSATLTSAKEELSQNIFYFALPKDLELDKPNIKFGLSKSGGKYIIEMAADKLAKNVKIAIGEENIVFSDNYFDLLPGVKKQVSFSSDKIIEQKDFKLTSLVDTY